MKRKILLVIFLITSLCYSQGIKGGIRNYIQNILFTEINVDTVKADIITVESTIRTSGNAGTVATSFANSGTITGLEYGDGYNHITVLAITNVELGTPDPGNALAFGDTIYTFPEGIQVVEWFQQNLALTTVGFTTDTPELGIGSIVGTGAQATLGAAGATMEDYSVGAAVDSCGGTSEAIGPIGATAGIFTGIALNDTSKVKSICLNVADTWNASVTDSLVVSGTVSFKWTTLE